MWNSEEAFEKSYAYFSDESEIREIFEGAGLTRNASASADGVGARRWLGRQFHASVNWDDPTSSDAARKAWAAYLRRLAARRQWDLIGELDGALHRDGYCFSDNEIRALQSAPFHPPHNRDGAWPRDHLKLFISHVSSQKEWVGHLAESLLPERVAAFVAHEDIEPTLDWQLEIERALRESDALVAVVSEGFHSSYWTDQACGFALGRGIPALALRCGADPRGFLAKWQALAGLGRSHSAIAGDIAKALSRDPRTRGKMQFLLAVRFAGSRSFSEAEQTLTSLEQLAPLDAAAIQIATEGFRYNVQCQGASGVARRLGLLVGEDIAILEIL